MNSLAKVTQVCAYGGERVNITPRFSDSLNFLPNKEVTLSCANIFLTIMSRSVNNIIAPYCFISRGFKDPS